MKPVIDKDGRETGVIAPTTKVTERRRAPAKRIAALAQIPSHHRSRRLTSKTERIYDAQDLVHWILLITCSLRIDSVRFIFLD